MGNNATLVERLNHLAASLAQRADDDDWYGTAAVMHEAADRIAEFEASLRKSESTNAKLMRERTLDGGLAHIAELEAERDGLEAALTAIVAQSRVTPDHSIEQAYDLARGIARAALSTQGGGEMSEPDEIFGDALAKAGSKWEVMPDKAAARIAELEASNAVCHRDIEALMSSADILEARNAKLEAERDKWAKLAGELFHAEHRQLVSEAERGAAVLAEPDEAQDQA